MNVCVCVCYGEVQPRWCGVVYSDGRKCMQRKRPWLITDKWHITLITHFPSPLSARQSVISTLMTVSHVGCCNWFWWGKREESNLYHAIVRPTRVLSTHGTVGELNTILISCNCAAKHIDRTKVHLRCFPDRLWGYQRSASHQFAKSILNEGRAVSWALCTVYRYSKEECN